MKQVFVAVAGFLLFGVIGRAQFFRVDQSFSPEIDAQVYAIAFEPDEQALIGGRFSTVGNFEQRFLVRLNADGTVDSSFMIMDEIFNSVYPSARIDQIRLLNSKIFVRSAYSGPGLTRLSTHGELEQGYGMYAPFTVDQLDRAVYGRMTEYLRWDRVGRFNPDGTKDTNFIVKVGCCRNEGVNAIAMQNIGGAEKILIGGKFTSINDTNSIVNLARLNGDGSFDPTFQHFGYYPESVQIVVCQDGKFFVAGDNLLAKHLPTGSLDPSFEPSYGDLYDQVSGMAIQSDGSVILVGSASPSPGNSLLRRFHPDGSRDTNFNFLMNGRAHAVAVDSSNRIMIGGDFTNVNCIGRTYLTRLIPSETPDELPCIVPPPPPKPEPELTLTKLHGPKMVCCWTTNYPEYTLQATKRLRPNHPEKEKWVTVTNLPVVGESTLCVTNRILRWGRHYRLSK
jgi:uncharacterized delta-60 repeat protein